MPNQSPESYVNQDDEIDLFELVGALWNRKAIIFGVTAIVIALAVVYLVVAPKVYEAKILINQVQSADLAQLNVGKGKLGQYAQPVSPASAYALFQQNLQSINLAKNYFKANVEATYKEEGATGSTDKLLKDKFLKAVVVTTPDKKNTYVSVSHQYTDQALTAKWLNGYVAYIEKVTKEQLSNATRNNKALAIKEYKEEMESLRAVYSRRLQDNLVRLEEAHAIATKLNIKKPMISNIQIKMPSSALDESLLYMRGYKVLEVEIETLKERKQVDSFIPRIRTLQEIVSYLNSVKYTMDTLQVINIDSWAEAPEESIKPKKALVLFLAGILGGMVGVFIALILWAMGNRKKEL